MRLTWPLTGRAEELRVIETAISDPGLSGIVVCGAAGVGKSRIAREALLRAESTGRQTRWALGTSSARNLPLGAFASWAEASPTNSLQAVRRVIDALSTGPAGSAVVIGVDDAHLLDDLSTFVLHQIVQRRMAKVVLTIRDHDPIPPGTQEVWMAGRFDRLALQPVSQDDIAELLQATLGGRLDQDAANRLWELTRGNVLYLRSIVEQEVADGRLAQRQGRWQWNGDPVVPAVLADMIESRIGMLETAVSAVIDALAVGEPIELSSLQRIADPAAVEEADARGLISVERVDDRVEVRVAHPLYAEVRRKRATPTRLRRMRGLVAAQLAECDDGVDLRTAMRRAALSIDSDVTPDPDLFIRAAQGAANLADIPLADRLAEAAIRAGAGAEAYFIRAQALARRGRGQDADAVLADCPTDGFSESDHARLVFLRASTMFWAVGDVAGAKKLVDDARRTTPLESRGCLDAFVAMYWAALGNPTAALKASKNLVVDRLPSVVGAQAAWAVTVAAGDAGRTTEAVAAAESNDPFLPRSFHAHHMWFVLSDSARVTALMQSGRIQEAWRAAERLREQTADLPGGARVLCDVLTGRVALGAGHLDAACALLKPVVEMLSARAQRTDGNLYKCLIPYTTALALRGLTDDAAAALDVLDRHRHPSWQCVDHERALAHAWVAAGRGAVGRAVTTVLAAAETASQRGQFAAEVLCLQTAAQFGDQSRASRLHELAAIVEGPRAGLAARFAVALQGGNAAELAAISEEFERMGDLVGAVDAAAHAALVYRNGGQRGPAYGCAARADVLAQQCGGACTPALREATEPLPLTSREREIVMLLGEGLANRVIAARLHLSERTVESHIYHAMTKTGATGREELAALLPRR